ncbi:MULTISPECIES: helix-turn-helix transcriptional regulator [Roseateles]|uniref:LuxR family transcriptional regulator n=1 Tax=Pelomonas caseinilytica TaxID=2906763 RepID=A0ABS8XGF7_9BURK|nr:MULTISPECIES: LuxR family transcriptional regulator [unclassified Roseateles]MCE4539966.1 LuxR family transcriptional regulator [Pelomonas sp. P7]HEV6966217.1 LuxR family transcriptional regulator [Roseateles sp.]
MNLQRYEQVSQAADLTSFRQGLIDFANDLDFGLVVGVLAVEHRGPGSRAEYFSVGNTPEKFLEASRDPEYARRDPVHKQLMRQSTPLIYDQNFYVEAGAGELWEMIAPFGYRTGVAVGVHMPGYKRLLLGMDREDPLPRDPVQLNRLIADLQLLAVHAQDAAARLLTPKNAPKLPARQLEILRLTMEGKSAWVVGSLLGISENTVNYHMKQLFKQLDVSTKGQAVLKAMELGLL